MDNLFEDLTKDLGAGNQGGALKTITFGRWDDVLTWPTPSSVVGKEGESTGNVAMRAGAKAFHLYATDETVDLKINSVGERDGKSHESKLAIFHPKSRAKLVNFMNAVQNDELFFIVNDNNGVSYLLGGPKRGADLDSSELTPGTKFSDKNGISISFKYNAEKSYIYTGTDPAAAVVAP